MQGQIAWVRDYVMYSALISLDKYLSLTKVIYIRYKVVPRN